MCQKSFFNQQPSIAALNCIFGWLCASLFAYQSAIAQDTTLVVEHIIRLQSQDHDVEEAVDGAIYFNSGHIKIVNDLVNAMGLHFEHLPIERGQTIQNAYLQFTAAEPSFGISEVSIAAELHSKPKAFSSASYNVSSRSTTENLVQWTVYDWPVQGQSSSRQRSPDLSAILQEIVDREDWLKHNSLNLLFTGDGLSNAVSYDLNPELAPRLVIETSKTYHTGSGDNIYINEIVSNNGSSAKEHDRGDDWAELYNANPYPIALKDLCVSDNPYNYCKWQIESPIYIDAEDFIRLWFDDSPQLGPCHIPFKLDAEGESLFISQLLPDGQYQLLDSISFPALAAGRCFGRTEDAGPEWAKLGRASPSRSNKGSGLYYDAEVEFSIEGGAYELGTSIFLSSSNSEAQIRYSIDGSPPDSSSLLFTDSLYLNEPMLIRAVAWMPGYEKSNENQEFYYLRETHDLPVFHLSIDPLHLWNHGEGFYVSGESGQLGQCAAIARNWNREWERLSRAQFFDQQGTKVFDLEAGAKIGGGCSRNFAKKQFNLFFRGDKIEYPIFSHSPIQKYKRLKLRNGGTDYDNAIIRDASIAAMLRNQIDLDILECEPLVLYLNGDYFGAYVLREFYGRHYFKHHYGVDRDDLDFIKNPYQWPIQKEGSYEAWQQLSTFIRENSMTEADNYEHLQNLIDLNEYMNYHIVEIYLANYDWPQNNVGVWKQRQGGKWRWLLYDLDISSGRTAGYSCTASYNMIDHATSTSGPAWPNGEASTLFLRKTLENQDFRSEFVQRTCTFAQTIFSPSRSIAYIDSMVADFSPEMPAMRSTFANAPESWSQWSMGPGGGSQTSWDQNLDAFRGFFEERLPHVLSNFQQHFAMSGHYLLSINNDADSGGKVLFHKNEMTVPHHYTASYFNDVPIMIQAVPDPGYRFLKWAETGQTAPLIYFRSDTDTSLTPIFVDEESIKANTTDSNYSFVIVPNPASEQLSLLWLSKPVAAVQITIVNDTGIEVYSLQSSQSTIADLEIDISAFTNGLYLLKVNTGASWMVKKFVKI